MKEARHKKSHIMSLYETSRISKSTESSLVVANGWGEGNEEQLLNGYRVLFCSEEKVLELDRGGDGHLFL